MVKCSTVGVLSNAFDKSKNITSVALEEFREVHQFSNIQNILVQ